MLSTLVGWETIQNEILRVLSEKAGQTHNVAELAKDVAEKLNVEQHRVLRILTNLLCEGEIQGTVSV